MSDQPDLLQQLEAARTAYVSVLMEKNFLERAVAHLNFHHNAHDGIVFVDAEQRVVYANPYFLEMMNLSDPKAILGQPLPANLWSNPEDAQRLFDDVRQNGFVRERELHLQSAAQEPVFAMCSSVATRTPDGEFMGVEMMFCNITSKRNIQVELAQRTKQLERAIEFSRMTLDFLMEAVRRGATGAELMDAMRQMQEELNKIAG